MDSSTRPDPVTRLLSRIREGDDRARDELFLVVYEHLIRIADRHVRSWESQTIQANDLVHEAFVKLIPSLAREWSNRSHFFAVASRAMRQVLIEYARRRSAAKRGGGRIQVTLSGLAGEHTLTLDQLISLDDALERLDRLNPRLRQVVDMRFFAGMDQKAIAELLGVSERTIERDWAKAKMFLHRELFGGDA